MSELAELLSGRDARCALACHDIAAIYRILNDAGVSQARIAHATGQRQSEVSAVLSGRQVRSVAVLERIADGLGVPRGRMGLAYFSGHGPGEGPATEDDEQDTRQNLLRHGATVLFGAPIFGVGKPVTAREVSTPRWQRIGASDVEWVRSVTDRLDLLANDLGGASLASILHDHG